MKAIKLVHEKFRTREGVVIEFKVWQVSVTDDYPEGFRYSFFAVFDGEVVVGYDNHRPKGHHRHVEGREEPYLFQGLDKLREDFQSDLNRALKTVRKKEK